MCSQLNTIFSLQERFQALGAVYKLLSDKDRRAVYDETGEIDEGDDMDPDKDWDQYWRLLFKVGQKFPQKVFTRSMRYKRLVENPKTMGDTKNHSVPRVGFQTVLK